MCDADLMADTPDPQPLDLTPYKAWADPPYDNPCPRGSGPSVARALLVEVERLRAENARLRQWGGMR